MTYVVVIHRTSRPRDAITWILAYDQEQERDKVEEAALKRHLSTERYKDFTPYDFKVNITLTLKPGDIKNL
jgi:hypothetical protein